MGRIIGLSLVISFVHGQPIQRASGARGMGGSVPLDMIEHALGTHTIPIANHDNN
ncbi:MAG: hypothetical protein ABSF22_01080 [Bryobacteraceae bacterium]|jgi:hypothetical protein